ncbi:hypothetical protein BST61_g11128 [Cercospora zeina]
MKYTFFAGLMGLATVTASYAPPSQPDAKTCDCYAKLTQCQNGPDANMAQCSSDFASCSGTNPYTGSTDSVQAYFDNLKSCCTTTSNVPVASATASATSANGPVVSASGTPDAKTCDCYSELTQCQNGPDANMAQCSSDFASCSGTNPYTGSTDQVQAYFNNLKSCCPTSSNGPVVSATASVTSANGPVVSASGKPDSKTCDCYNKLGQCQNGPNANQAQCSSDFASCSGMNPYTTGFDITGFFNNLKNNCPTSSNGPVVSATPTAGATGGKPDAKICDCYNQLGQCQNAPNANQAQCSSDFASCSGMNPYTTGYDITGFFNNLKNNCPTSSNGPVVSATPTAGATGGKPDAKICDCYNKLGQCQNAPNANQAQCSSDFASCSGMNPYTTGFDITGFFNNLKNNCPAGGAPGPSSQNGPAASASPVPSPSGPIDSKTCACYAQDTTCRNAPNANQAQCSADFASCSGYNPFSQDTATVQAYFANLDKACSQTGGASSATGGAGSSGAGYLPHTMYPVNGNETGNRTVIYTGAANHVHIGASALVAGMAAMLVL